MSCFKARLDHGFRQNNHFKFVTILCGMALVGALLDTYYLTKQGKVRFVRHPDGSVEIEGDEDSVNELAQIVQQQDQPLIQEII